MKRHQVLIVGELNVDLILSNIEGQITIGKEIFSRDMTLTLGSSSAIFANNLTRLGTKVSFVGRIGRDSFADLVMSSLEKAGVDITNIIETADNYTGITVAMSYGDDRAMVTYPGAMSDLTVDDITDAHLRSAQHMHVSSIFLQEGLLPGIVPLFRRAKEMGMTTSLDPQWDPHEKWNVDLEALLPFVDIFLPNEAELMNMTGTKTITAGIDKILPFAHHIVVKQGVRGASLFYENSRIDMPAFLNENVVDAIGAGDSFNSGFINAFIQGKSLKTCMERGAVTGAINTTAAGGTKAFEDLTSVKKMAMEKFNHRLD